MYEIDTFKKSIYILFLVKIDSSLVTMQFNFKVDFGIVEVNHLKGVYYVVLEFCNVVKIITSDYDVKA